MTNTPFFDNESAGSGHTGVGSTAEFGLSRIVRIKLDQRHRTATLVASIDQPEGLTASSQGDAQPLPGGGSFVGWGNLNYISEFNSAGGLVFNGQFPTGVDTYRAYLYSRPERRLSWTWHPHRPAPQSPRRERAA